MSKQDRLFLVRTAVFAMETEIVYGVACVVANPISPITSGLSLSLFSPLYFDGDTAVQGDGFLAIRHHSVHHSSFVAFYSG